MSSDQVEGRARLPISREQQLEIEMLVQQIARLDRGEADPEDFRRFRLENGIYGIRGEPDQHMVRVKVRYGKLTAGQLDALADIANEFTPNKSVHLTTRQDVQFHYVHRHSLPRVLTLLAEAGLTTREACGNTVRNVTACPFSGVSATEVFDVRPYAEAVSSYFLRNPINQNLPRKFKIAFEGCTEDHARTAIHDVGVVAAIRGAGGTEECGFRIYLGGGLGAQPACAKLLEEFTPAPLMIPTIEAVLRVFDRFGERREDHAHRMRARLKFLIREWGWDRFREAVLKERRTVFLTQSGRGVAEPDLATEPPPFTPEAVDRIAEEAQAFQMNGMRTGEGFTQSAGSLVTGGSYYEWRSTNVIEQKQPGWCCVIVRARLGDLSARELRHLSRIASWYCGGRVQVSISQNLMFRWVPELLLGWVYQELDRIGLAHAGADRLADITRCPGADTCQIAITHSRGLAQALEPLVEGSLGELPELGQLSIKISGCMNSCGQHHIADLGFYGSSENVRGHELPKYVVMLGGRTREGLAEFGVPVAQIPARRIPDAVRELLLYYRQNKKNEEHFRDFVARLGKAAFRTLLGKYQSVASYEDSPELFRDLGVEEEFHVMVGAGECAGGVGEGPKDRDDADSRPTHHAPTGDRAASTAGGHP